MDQPCLNPPTCRLFGCAQEHIWTPGVFETSEYSAVNNDALLPMGTGQPAGAAAITSGLQLLSG